MRNSSDKEKQKYAFCLQGIRMRRDKREEQKTDVRSAKKKIQQSEKYSLLELF